MQHIPGCRNISGKTEIRHDDTLWKDPQRLEENGVTLKSLCEFSKSETTFFGHAFGKSGISSYPEKIMSIINTPAPSTPNEVKSLLGMAQYVARFIPDHAAITEHLRKLTLQDATWNGRHLKSKHSRVLKKLELFADASPEGVGAIFTQEGKVPR